MCLSQEALISACMVNIIFSISPDPPPYLEGSPGLQAWIWPTGTHDAHWQGQLAHGNAAFTGAGGMVPRAAMQTVRRGMGTCSMGAGL